MLSNYLLSTDSMVLSCCQHNWCFIHGNTQINAHPPLGKICKVLCTFSEAITAIHHIVLQATCFAKRKGLVMLQPSGCHREMQLSNIRYWHQLNMLRHNCYPMTTDAVYEQHASDHAVATTRWLQRDKFLSLYELWLASLTIHHTV